VQTPFGKGTVKESGNVYIIDIDAKVGALVRSGPMVGRIVEVGEGETGTITIDYSHPFGGESLDCDITLEGIGTGTKSE
jgi:FKBP-type peptidyl-prolyl cis-trans isomerase 2